MIQRVTSILFVVFFIFSCGTTKKTTQFENLPTWVKSKPVLPTYYIGIASAQKTANINDYQTMAKNSALADLAREISVNISTSSVLQQFENSFGYAEDFNNMVKTSSQKLLEGYELVNTFEDETSYWVYYRLSKQKYKEQKALRKKNAMAIGLDYYKKAIKDKDNLNYNNAVQYYVKGLESIKPYLAESLETSYENENIFLGNELYTGLTRLLNSINVEPKSKMLNVKNGQRLTSNELMFVIKNTSGKVLQDLPVLFYADGKPVRSNKAQSNIVGEVGYNMQQVKAKFGSINFEARVDMNILAQNATHDPMFRKLLRKFDAPKGYIKVNVNNPTLYVTSVEKNLGSSIDPKIVETRVIQLLAKNNYPVVLDKAKADFILEFNLDTKKGRKDGRQFYANLLGSMKIFNAQKQVVLLNPFNNIEGVQLNYNDAGLDAYDKIIKDLNKNLLLKLNESVK